MMAREMSPTEDGTTSSDDHARLPGARVVQLDIAGTAVFLAALAIAVPLRSHRLRNS
jgi:hypothetical protein